MAHSVARGNRTVEMTAAGTFAMTDMTAFRLRNMNTVAVMLTRKLLERTVILIYSTTMMDV